LPPLVSWRNVHRHEPAPYHHLLRPKQPTPTSSFSPSFASPFRLRVSERTALVLRSYATASWNRPHDGRTNFALGHERFTQAAGSRNGRAHRWWRDRSSPRPTPGVVIRRRHTSSLRTMASKRRCRMICSGSTRRARSGRLSTSLASSLPGMVRPSAPRELHWSAQLTDNPFFGLT
jgi:hypothetical protein